MAKHFNIIKPANFASWSNSQGATDAGRNLFIYVHNVRDLYCAFEGLQNCCLKQFKRHGGLDLNYLVESSTLKRISRAARKFAASFGEYYDMEADRAARIELAKDIYNTCESI